MNLLHSPTALDRKKNRQGGIDTLMSKRKTDVCNT